MRFPTENPLCVPLFVLFFKEKKKKKKNQSRFIFPLLKQFLNNFEQNERASDAA